MLSLNREDYRYSLLIAVSLHLVLFLVLFLTLHHRTKLLFLSSPSLQVIRATAIPMDALVKKSTPKIEKIKPMMPRATIKTLSKPVLIKKSPIMLPIKKKKAHKDEQTKLTSLKIPNKQPSQVEKRIPIQKKQVKVMHKSKKITPKPLSKSLKLVEKNVQQLLDQELKSLEKQSINASHHAVILGKYRRLILQAIAQQWIIPPEVNKHSETNLTVQLAPGGIVLEVLIVKSSGNLILDRSAQAAVYKASPLPVPKNKDLFHTFRQINLTLRPESVMTQ